MRLIQHGRPVSPLLVLCRKYGVDVQDNVSPQELNDELQQKWFKEGYLRYQIKGDPPEADDRELLRQLDLTDTVTPVADIDPHDPYWGSIEPLPVHMYAGALGLGALRARMISRLAFLAYYHGHYLFECSTVYLLGGQRKLDPEKESREVLCTPAELPFKPGWVPPAEMPTTEAGMMRLVVEQSVLPTDWTYYVADAVLQPKDPAKPDGEKRSPNTGDTVRTLFDEGFRRRTGGKIWLYFQEDSRWEEVNPDPSALPLGNYLAVSNQPFVEYQQLAVQRTLPPRYTVRACGPASSLTLPLSAYLDNIAKQVFEELQGIRS